MPLFPKVQSPCPYKADLSAVMDGDFCRMCKRRVVDLTAWTDGERTAFLSACADEVCVSYRLPLRAAAIAAALVAAPTLAAAQDPSTAPPTPVEAQAVDELDDGLIFVGGITDPANAEFVAVAEDEAVPELPVVYEDDPAPGSSEARLHPGA